jgi:hypothetical protein
MKYLLITSILFCLFSCNPAKKASQFFHTRADSASKWCAEAYPCTGIDTVITVRSDSAAYLQSIDELTASVKWLTGLTDSLFGAVHVDSNCSRYSAVIKNLQDRLKLLSVNGKPKPVIEYKDHIVKVIDSAQVTNVRSQLTIELKGHQKTSQQLADSNKERDEWKKKAKQRFWLLIGIILLVGIYIGLKLKKL